MGSFESNFRFAFAIGAAALIWVWNSTPVDERVHRFALIFAALGVAVLVACIWVAWRFQRTVHRLRSLAPDDRDAILGKYFSEESREFYASRLAKEGSVEADGMVERFPFSPLDRRESAILFLSLVVLAALALATALGLISAPSAWHSPSLAVGALAVAALPIVSRRLVRLESVLEVTPFGLVEVRGDGQRRWLYWGQPMVLRPNRWLRRLELSPQGSNDHIPLHFGRVGFQRLVQVVLQRGGFDSAGSDA